MDKQEQRSQSEDIDDPIVISPLATPYRALISVDREDLKKKFDAHWSIYKDYIIKKYKIKARSPNKARGMAESTIGYTGLYEDQILDAATSRLIKENVEILHIEEFDLHNFDTEGVDKATIVVIYFPFPELIFEGELDWEVETPPSIENLEEGWELRKNVLLTKYKVEGEELSFDDVIKKEGFESSEDMYKDFEAQHKEYLRQLKVTTVFDKLVDRILSQAKIPAAPQRYIDDRTDKLMQDHFNRFKDDKKAAYESVGATNDNQVRQKLTGHVMKELLNHMAVRELARMKGVPYQDLQGIQDAVMDSVIWKTVDETPRSM